MMYEVRRKEKTPTGGPFGTPWGFCVKEDLLDAVTEYGEFLFNGRVLPYNRVEIHRQN